MTRQRSRRFDRFAKLVEALESSGPVHRADLLRVEAPLRVCPLGAHVDHQGGVVTGITVDRSVLMVAAPLEEPVFRVESLEFEGSVTVDLANPQSVPQGDWGDYVRAAVSALTAEHEVERGLRAVVTGDLVAAGLSSSAAVLVSYLLGLASRNSLDLPREEVASLVQRAENSYIGVASGRLDQSIILFAEKGSLTCVDCSDLRIEQIPSPSDLVDYRVLVAFSGVGRALGGTGFNTRVDQCREAAKILLERGGEAPRDNPVLSDVPPEVFEQLGADLPRIPRRRAAHFFGEQRRVQKGVEAWRQGDLLRFGGLMDSSGASSIQNYESGTAELVTLYELLRNAPGVFGTRFSGGGFGGCCVALIETEAGESIIDTVRQRYQAAHPKAAAAASFHICRPGGPAQILGLEG